MIEIKLLDTITAIDADQWNAHTGSYPFNRHEFLSALEQSGSVDQQSGWQTAHLTVYKGDQLIAVMPNYLKHHSWGEYVFDWSWADAYQRHGRNYYPKLVAAIPFTPATGPRLACKQPLSHDDYAAIAARVKAYCQEHNISGWHILFPAEAESDAWQLDTFSRRTGIQYHWYNHGYSSFNDFLARCSSRKRKTLRKERALIDGYKLNFKTLVGHEITEQQWDQFYYFYQTTYAKRSGHGGYLQRSFFSELSTHMPENLVLVMVEHEQQAIAAALSFRSDDTLYGRYWGCAQELDGLHFETCYYQGIDYCIAEGINKFDAGAQGEHKIQRGFEPTFTYSSHWLKDPQMNAAVADFVARETPLIHSEYEHLIKKLPFRKENNNDT